ncbi:MAG TPA: hypothetical protein VG816_15305 [Solirubrobacterales bacterium]|nr:hypothetical protein [Solirubrobacterales bacterium]
MIFVLAGIAAWLAIAVVVGFFFARALALKEGDDSLEASAELGAQLQLVKEPSSKGERAA